LKGITKLELQTLSNTPYQLNMEINLDFPFWKELKENREYGVRLKTKYLDLAFLQLDRKQEVEGKQTFTFISSSYKLKTARPTQLATIYKGSLAQFLGNLSSDFYFDFISADQEITIDTGVSNNLELITEATQKAKGYNWVEAGIVDTGAGYKTRIVVGNFGQDLENYYNATLDKAFKPLDCFQSAKLDDFDNDSTANLSYLNENDSGDTFKYLKPVSNSGSGGGASNSTLTLTNPSATYIQGQFPLVNLTNPTTGQPDYFIENPFYNRTTDTFEIFNSSGTSNSEIGDGINVIDGEATLYAEAVAYIKRKNLIRQITMNATAKRVFLPMTLCYLRYNEKITLTDREVINTYNIDDKFVMDNTTFDLTKISI